MTSPSSLISTTDYVLFGAFLTTSLVIGSLFGICRKSNSAISYVLADKQFGALPVALSVFTSFWSATAILGYPSEMYQHGSMIWLMSIGNILSSILTASVFVPKLRSLELISLYEYFELRFHRSVKIAVSMCFVVQNVLYLAVVIYSPSLAMQQVLGLDIWLSISLITAVCIFYSTIGGVKGVIWTDVFQCIIITVGLITLLALGLKKTGGLPKAFSESKSGERIEFFIFDFDPRARHTFFSVIIGSFIMTLGVYSFNQINVQRFLSIRTDKHAKMAVYLNLAGLLISLSLCVLIGMVIYSYYVGCDPHLNGTIPGHNLILPLFVIETLGRIPGFTGLFLATLCSGTMSSVSSILNSLAAVIVYDFVKPVLSRCNNKFSNWLLLLRLMTIALGLLSFLMILVVQKIGFILQAAISILGIYGGPITSLFLVGFFVPFVRWKSALTGFLVSLVFQTWLLVGSVVTSQQIRPPPKLLNTSTCTSVNVTTWEEYRSTFYDSPSDLHGIAGFYGISYMWHSVTGLLSCGLTTILISLICGEFKRRKEFVIDERYLIKPSWLPVWNGSFRGFSKTTQKGINFDSSESSNEVDEKKEQPIVLSEGQRSTSIISCLSTE